ncbi:MAG: PilZ domain-containing protein [Gammaproteobacteria bacterium]|nr:PilZ domain-containing protein [Gammaproteobacteria bacterium]
MIEERRTGARMAVSQEVMLIHQQGHRLCKIHDLSLKGAMLELGWGALTRDAPVELSISLPSAKGKSSYRLPAKVARISTQGTAVKFNELGSVAREAMQRYLQTGAQAV